MGVDGIPVEKWSADVFELIRKQCGGLLEIAADTLTRSFLRYTKLKFQGSLNDFV